MRVLITGGNGQVGYCLTEQLKEHDNVEVLSLDVDGLDITDCRSCGRWSSSDADSKILAS